MKRYCDFTDISDGKKYDENDLVEASCNGCKGHASCCHGMGASIVLDPLDAFRLMKIQKMTFEELLVDKIEMNLVDGIILPNLKMTGVLEQCAFLNEKGRCSVHQARPGICRIFPLGRIYEEGDYKYFLQTGECKNQSTTKSNVGKWIDTVEQQTNRDFINQWHSFLLEIQEQMQETTQEELKKKMNMYLLNLFYLTKYRLEEDFYGQFAERMAVIKSAM